MHWYKHTLLDNLDVAVQFNISYRPNDQETKVVCVSLHDMPGYVPWWRPSTCFFLYVSVTELKRVAGFFFQIWSVDKFLPYHETLVTIISNRFLTFLIKCSNYNVFLVIKQCYFISYRQKTKITNNIGNSRHYLIIVSTMCKVNDIFIFEYRT